MQRQVPGLIAEVAHEDFSRKHRETSAGQAVIALQSRAQAGQRPAGRRRSSKSTSTQRACSARGGDRARPSVSSHRQAPARPRRTAWAAGRSACARAAAGGVPPPPASGRTRATPEARAGPGRQQLHALRALAAKGQQRHYGRPPARSCSIRRGVALGLRQAGLRAASSPELSSTMSCSQPWRCGVGAPAQWRAAAPAALLPAGCAASRSAGSAPLRRARPGRGQRAAAFQGCAPLPGALRLCRAGPGVAFWRQPPVLTTRTMARWAGAAASSRRRGCREGWRWRPGVWRCGWPGAGPAGLAVRRVAAAPRRAGAPTPVRRRRPRLRGSTSLRAPTAPPAHAPRAA